MRYRRGRVSIQSESVRSTGRTCLRWRPLKRSVMEGGRERKVQLEAFYNASSTACNSLADPARAHEPPRSCSVARRTERNMYTYMDNQQTRQSGAMVYGRIPRAVVDVQTCSSVTVWLPFLGWRAIQGLSVNGPRESGPGRSPTDLGEATLRERNTSAKGTSRRLQRGGLDGRRNGILQTQRAQRADNAIANLYRTMLSVFPPLWTCLFLCFVCSQQ